MENIESTESTDSLDKILFPWLKKNWKQVTKFLATSLSAIVVALGVCHFYLQEVVKSHATSEIKPYMCMANGFLAGGFTIDSSNVEIPSDAIDDLDFAADEFLKRGETQLATTAIGGLANIISASSSPIELENYNQKIKEYMKEAPYTPAICKGLSLYALRTGDSNSAHEYAVKGLAMSSDLGDSFRASDFNWSLAKIAVARNQIEPAVMRIKKANELDPAYYQQFHVFQELDSLELSGEMDRLETFYRGFRTRFQKVASKHGNQVTTISSRKPALSEVPNAEEALRLSQLTVLDGYVANVTNQGGTDVVITQLELSCIGFESLYAVPIRKSIPSGGQPFAIRSLNVLSSSGYRFVPNRFSTVVQSLIAKQNSTGVRALFCNKESELLQGKPAKDIIRVPATCKLCCRQDGVFKQSIAEFDCIAVLVQVPTNEGKYINLDSYLEPSSNE